MHPRILKASLLAALLTATALGAQSPAAPSFPNTPAGTVVKAWYDAYASGDTVRILDFYRRYQPERIAQNTVQFRTAAGGFDIVSIERAEPRRIEYVARERKTPQTYYAAVDLSSTDPPQIATSYLIPLGPNASLETARIDATRRAKIIDAAIAKLDSFYVFPDVSAHYGRPLARGRMVRNSEEMASYLLDEAGVAVVPGGTFGDDRCIRLSFAASAEDLTVALKRIARALSGA